MQVYCGSKTNFFLEYKIVLVKNITPRIKLEIEIEFSFSPEYIRRPQIQPEF